MQRVLLTFTGFHDPFHPGPVAGSEQEGPILTLLGALRFDWVILFSTPGTTELTEETARAIRRRHPPVLTRVFHLPLKDPTDYGAILWGVRRALRELLSGFAGSHFYVATASGTPQMHAAWALLIAGGEIPGRILHVRPPQFVSRSQPLVSEFDLAKVVRLKARAAALGEARFLLGSPTSSTALLAESDRRIDLASLSEQFGIVGEDPAFLRALERACLAAEYNEPVLIQGENGTGKEIIAKLIHARSQRSGRRMVTVNCSTIPPELAESVLFGHRKGSFTGAASDHEGKFKAAHGSTLFLDEIGELPASVQPKLLRALQEKVIEPIGRPEEEVDVRVISATNRDLEQAVHKGTFRKDLYYRLQVVLVEIPPLRNRRGDIPRLAVSFLESFSRQNNRFWQFTPDALGKIQAYNWPGNVRQLRHTVIEAAIMCSGKKIRAEHLHLPPVRSGEGPLPEPHEGFSLESYLKDVRRKLFRRALEISGGNQSLAGRLLGVTPAAVSRFVRESGQ